MKDEPNFRSGSQDQWFSGGGTASDRRPSEEALSGAESRRDLRSTEVQRRETVEQSGQEQPQHRVSWHAQEELARKTDIRSGSHISGPRCPRSMV